MATILWKNGKSERFPAEEVARKLQEGWGVTDEPIKDADLEDKVEDLEDKVEELEDKLEELTEEQPKPKKKGFLGKKK